MQPEHFLKKDITTSQDLSAGALSYTTVTSRNFKLEEITLKASVGITETVTVTRVSKQGSNYNTVMVSQTLTNDTSFVYRPTGECNFIASDEVKIQCTNANGTGIVYVTIKRSEL